MISAVALIAGLACRQDGTTFQFRPKVGEKYRYKVKMEDDAGNSQFPPGVKAFNVFKIAGIKDGWFTVHQTLELISAEGKTDTQLFATFRVDPQLNSELISSAEETKAGGAGAGMSAAVNGCFGVMFSPNPIKLNEAWNSPFDAVGATKKFLPAIPPEAKPKLDGKGERTITLTKLDDTAGFFKTMIAYTMNIAVEENGQKQTIEFILTTDQEASVDRATGMPIKLDRKFKINMKLGPESQGISGTVHLERVP